MFKVSALLIKNGIIDLHVLYSHLGPSYEEMKTAYNKRLLDAREKVTIYFACLYGIQLSNIHIPLEHLATLQQLPTLRIIPQSKSLTTVSLNKDEKDDEPETGKKIRSESVVPENQKVSLCIALIELGCWLEADDLIQLLPPYSVPHSPQVGYYGTRVAWGVYYFSGIY